MGFRIRVADMVCHASLGRTVPLDAWGSDRAGVIFRVEDPHAAVLVFAAGRIVCAGTRSLEDAQAAARKVVAQLRKAGLSLPLPPLEIESMVAVSAVRNRLNLEEIAFALEGALYEPERFPALRYPLPWPGRTLLLFPSGKILCAGLQGHQEAQEALSLLHDRLSSVGIAADPA
ncbi:MAG: hypothetical protein HY520_03515 [Candidatus Aenigmarchaeota archaeon]|nr:hypothetical protein [Candidatus Aenigmarchaeota archaeon]